MTPESLSVKVDTIVSKAEIALNKFAIKAQSELLDQMGILLNKLELDANGLIKQSQANRKILAQAEQYFNKGMKQSGYYESLDGISSTVGNITGANAAYFNTVVEGFKPDAQYIKALQKQTITQAESLLANEGIELMLKQPIANILTQNINTGAAYKDLVNQLKTFITGSPGVDGALQRYSKQIVTDTLFNYNRAYQEAISENTGLNWIKYVGGATFAADNPKKFTTRDFCLSKMGRYYEKSDVERWASGTWAGKRAGTTSSTIFIYAGGYNCRHQIIYVSENAVPQTNKDAKKLMKKAKEVGDEVDNVAKKLATKYKAGLTPLNYKGYDSMVRKANELNGNVFDGFKGHEGVKDAVRTTIITDKKNLENVAADLKKNGITQRQKVQDFTSSSGYRGYLTNVKLSNGVIGEVQINTPEMIFAKEEPAIAKMVIGEQKWNEIQKKTGLEGGLGHKYYEEERVMPKHSPERKEILRKSREYYKNFYYSYPEPWP